MDEDWPSNIGEYTIVDKVLQTPRSTVYSAFDHVGKRFVIKESKKDSQPEYQLLTEFDYPNIIKPIDYLHINDLYYIIFPSAQGGDFLDKLTAEGPFDAEFVRKMMRDIFETVAYLHSAGVIHREITLENILIFYQRGTETYKLGGFSLAIKSPTSNECCGTIPYIAPEVIEKKEYDNKVDCWNLGIIMYALFTCTYPYSEKFEPTEVDYSHIPEEASDLIRHLLCPLPSDRYSADQALRHSFFTKH